MCRSLEQVDPAARAADVRRLRFYLGLNSQHLLSHYAPAQLFTLSDDQLAATTAAAQAAAEYKRKRALWDQLKQRKFSGASSIECHACKRGDRITVRVQQKRSADEGMTVTAQCACGRSWHL